MKWVDGVSRRTFLGLLLAWGIGLLLSGCSWTPQTAETEIYFMRHGETTWNKARKLQGALPHPELTPFGVKLAEEAADGMRAQGISFDRVYASPLRRAWHTAEIVAAKCGTPPLADARIAEMNFGVYQGTSSAPEAYADDNIRAFFQAPEKYEPRGPGAESFDDVGARVAEFLEKELKPQEGRSRRILCVTHAFVLRALLRHLSGAPLADLYKGPKSPNCGVHVLRLKNGKFSVKETGRIFYDPALTQKLGAF